MDAKEVTKTELKQHMNESGILDGVMQWVVLAIVFTILPGLLYAVTSAQPAIPSGNVWNITQGVVNSTTSSSFGTLVIVLIVLAIVIIISVLLLLGGMRRK